jgi:hypothetical protein
MHPSHVLEFPEVGIAFSYGFVVLFSAITTWAAWKKKVCFLAWLLLAIGAIFFFCDLSYILTSIGAPQSWIRFEHYFVALFGTVTALCLAPPLAFRFVDYIYEMKRSGLIRDKTANLSGFCSVLIHWESQSKATVVTVNQSMVRWFVRHAIASAESVKPGANWIELLPHETEWIERMQQTAIGGKSWRNMETAATFDDQLTGFSWNMFLVDEAEKLILIEWYDSTGFVRGVERLRSELDVAMADNEKLRASNASILANQLKLLKCSISEDK